MKYSALILRGSCVRTINQIFLVMSRTTHYIGAARLAPSVSSARKPDSFAVLKTKATPLGRLCLVAKFQLRQAPTPLHRLSQAPLHLPVVPVRFYHPFLENDRLNLTCRKFEPWKIVRLRNIVKPEPYILCHQDFQVCRVSQYSLPVLLTA